MAIRLAKENESRMIESIKRYFLEEMGVEVGDLKASLLLDFFLKEIGPTIYNGAISDAQSVMTERVSDLEGSCYEAEFDYWERQGQRKGTSGTGGAQR